MVFDQRKAAQIAIDVSAWVEDALRDEQIMTSADDATRQIAQGVPLGKVARNAVVSRQGGAAPEDLIAPNRALLNIGAYHDVHQRFIRTALKQVIAANGAKYKTARFVGAPREAPAPEDDVIFQATMDGIVADALAATGYADTDDDAQRAKALTWATTYLVDTVPAHTWTHLTTVYALGGDVKAIGKQMKQAIDAQVRRLTDAQLKFDAE